MAPEGSWVHAPKDTFILGIKELAESDSSIPQTHIYFAHAYKVSIQGSLNASSKQHQLNIGTPSSGVMVIDYNQLLIENLESHNKIVENVWLIKYILFKNILLTNKNIKTYLLCSYNL